MDWSVAVLLTAVTGLCGAAFYGGRRLAILRRDLDDLNKLADSQKRVVHSLVRALGRAETFRQFTAELNKAVLGVDRDAVDKLFDELMPKKKP